MGRLAALGCDPTPLLVLPGWLAPLWAGVCDDAERIRREWSRVDAVETINALGEAM